MRIFVFRKRDLYITIAIAIIIFSLFIYGRLSEDQPVNSSQLKYNYQKLLPEEANIFIQNNPGIIILDVRSQQDFNQGHLINAQTIPFRNLKERLSQLNPNDTYIIYCQNGKDSLKASKLMAESGFSRIFNLIGGYQKWPYDIKKVH